jgi:hypothetical protein
MSFDKEESLWRVGILDRGNDASGPANRGPNLPQ